MGKKSRRQRASPAEPRREAIQARQEKMPASDPRVEADRLKEKFLRLSQDPTMKWDLRRYLVLLEYKEVMDESIGEGDNYDGEKFLTKADMKFVKSISRDEQELACVRVSATEIWMTIHLRNVEIDTAFQCLHRCIKICDQASELEKQVPIFLGILTRSKRSCLDALAGLRSTVLGVSVLEWKEDGTSSVASTVGCDQCVVCDKTYEDLGVIMLECCQRCQLTYYCSRECQLKHWKDHKKVCRKKGEFKAGDVAVLAAPLPSMEVTIGNPVRLLVPAPCDPNRLDPQKWVVKKNAAEAGRWSIFLVDTKDLRRCPPAIWKELGEEETQKFMELLVAQDAAEAAKAAGTVSEAEAAETLELAHERFEGYLWDLKKENELEQTLIECANEIVLALESAKGFDRDQTVEILDSQEVKASVEFLKDTCPDFLKIVLPHELHCYIDWEESTCASPEELDTDGSDQGDEHAISPTDKDDVVAPGIARAEGGLEQVD